MRKMLFGMTREVQWQTVSGPLALVGKQAAGLSPVVRPNSVDREQASHCMGTKEFLRR
jgi:hypothetical protein